MADALKAGKSFDELAEKAVAEKKAKGIDEGSYTKPKDLLPHIQEIVSSMPTGSTSPVVKVKAGKTEGFSILRIEDKRYPDDPKAREQAEKDVLNAKRSQVWEEYKSSQIKKRVKIREKFLKRLDLDSPKNDFSKLMGDKRVVAEIKGERPITVGDMMEKLLQMHYHGLEQAARSKKLNKDKRQALFGVIGKRLIETELSARELAENEEYLKGLKAFETEMLFGIFVERAVYPSVKVTEADEKAYYEDHKKEYLYPEMMRMTSLAFKSKRDAESAIKSLVKGADFNWVKNNADGVVTAVPDGEELAWNGSILSTRSFTPDIAKALAGARAGDFRLYESEKGQAYVLFIQEIIPERQQPFEEVKQVIMEKKFNENFVREMDDWFRKLKASSTIQVYVADLNK
jgi:hypothetical protein